MAEGRYTGLERKDVYVPSTCVRCGGKIKILQGYNQTDQGGNIQRMHIRFEHCKQYKKLLLKKQELRRFWFISLMVFLVLIGVVAFAYQAKGEEQRMVGEAHLVICNTVDQMVEYATSVNSVEVMSQEEQDRVLDGINKKAGTNACGSVLVRFFMGEAIVAIKYRGVKGEVMRIFITRIWDVEKQMWAVLRKPHIQYAVRYKRKKGKTA